MAQSLCVALAMLACLRPLWGLEANWTYQKSSRHHSQQTVQDVMDDRQNPLTTMIKETVRVEQVYNTLADSPRAPAQTLSAEESKGIHEN